MIHIIWYSSDKTRWKTWDTTWKFLPSNFQDKWVWVNRRFWSASPDQVSFYLWTRFRSRIGKNGHVWLYIMLWFVYYRLYMFFRGFREDRNHHFSNGPLGYLHLYIGEIIRLEKNSHMQQDFLRTFTGSQNFGYLTRKHNYQSCHVGEYFQVNNPVSKLTTQKYSIRKFFWNQTLSK